MNHRMLSKRSASISSWFLLVVYLNFMVSCSYYKAKTLDPLNNESIAREMKQKKKYIILHAGDEVWHLKDIVVDNDTQKLTGTIEALPDNHTYYKTAKPAPKTNRYRQRDYGSEEDKPIHEIHIYTPEIGAELNTQVNILFSSINKVEVYDTDVGTTIIAGFGGTVAAVAIVAIIIAATKSSCPFVYVSDGETYSFTGEMYGGAIYPSLERDDFMPLPGMKSLNGSYSLKIANELLEKQYVNLANLIVANHPENMEVVIDKNGNIQTLMNLQSPVTTVTDLGADYTREVLLRDNNAYLFQESNRNNDAISSLMMSFKRPESSNSAKLVINAKNSFWLDYSYGKFNELFGTYYHTFTEQQKKEPAHKLNQWSMEQNIPLSVYVETKDGWKFVDYFNSIGPLIARDIVMPIDLSDVSGTDVKIKLESGFMFWEVDYAAMDFSPNVDIDVRSISPALAMDEKGMKVSDLLSAADDKYLVQAEIGNYVTITYNAQEPQAGQKQTVFLHSRGYYEYIRDFKNLPKVSYLKSFEEKGAFTRFSKEQYDAFVGDQNIFAAALTQNDED